MTPHQTLDFDSCYRAVSSRDTRFDGRFYTAVTSTGIYCRPICPARTPARKNVRFYRHAAAAEAAGFRPCRRCRPELSPGDPGWDVPADLVGRALRLIDDGVADEHGVAGLAGRLHVTERHLLRIFTTRLGAGPLAVARTRRLLLAKQLLTETGLPITDVAFAAGFGSVRQFNASMRDAYGFSPTDLRASAGRLAVAGPGGEVTLRLGYRGPYDVEAMFGFLAARAIPGVEDVTPDHYRRAVPGGLVTVTPAAGHLTLSVALEDTRHLARVVARCRRLFDLDADPDAIAEALGPTAIGRLVERRPGLRVPGAFDGFELAVRAVVGQQVSVPGARTLLGRIAARAGTTVPPPGDAHRTGTADDPPGDARQAGTTGDPPGDAHRTGTADDPPGDARQAGTTGDPPGDARRTGTADDPPGDARQAGTTGDSPGDARRTGTAGDPSGGGRPYLLFPTAEQLAEADLAGLGMTGRRVETLKTLAGLVAGGELDLDGGADPADTAARLMAVPGIGPWTTGYIVMRALRDPDAWPDKDLGLVRAMKALGISEEETERWRPWRAYAALHLWSSS
ncbi:AlkA N-terminal domain-containing protein [Sphaerisporangium sp. B11E5]|uniref:AlkA N-terminal domain-containing protein n=1 Tax=Sphaerisporangium sp. B11E5 TaxID=3153563 RepID=UPI00325CAB03